MSILNTMRAKFHFLSLSTLARDAKVMERAHTLVSYFYYLLPVAAFQFVSNPTLGRVNFAPMGAPLVWVHWFDLTYPEVLSIVRLGLLGVALVAPFFHTSRIMRILVCVALWQAHALESSFGDYNHQWYPWLYTAFLFIFLPTQHKKKGTSFEENRTYLLYVFAAQMTFALIYMLAGTHKVIYSFIQSAAGEVGGLSPTGLSYQVADWVPKLGAEAAYADLVVSTPEFAFPAYLALILVQIAAPLAVLYPSTQRAWAVCIVAFHIGTYLIMGIQFPQWILLVPLLFFHAPLAARHDTALTKSAFPEKSH